MTTVVTPAITITRPIKNSPGGAEPDGELFLRTMARMNAISQTAQAPMYQRVVMRLLMSPPPRDFPYFGNEVMRADTRMEQMAGAEGFEPSALGFGDRCSDQTELRPCAARAFYPTHFRRQVGSTAWPRFSPTSESTPATPPAPRFSPTGRSRSCPSPRRKRGAVPCSGS